MFKFTSLIYYVYQKNIKFKIKNNNNAFSFMFIMFKFISLRSHVYQKNITFKIKNNNSAFSFMFINLDISKNNLLPKFPHNNEEE